jgi:hypothetical protein
MRMLQVFVNKPEGEEHLEDVGVYEMIILKLALKNRMRVWAVLASFRVWKRGELSRIR